ncbi:MAG TPA: hypothetical protein VGH87_26670, partial [Polyangiaceae bacterium]
MRRSAVIIVVAACAQASVAPVSNTFASGTRLRAIVLDAGGGAELFTGWHDAQLGIDCGFAKMSDGSIRCVPTATGFAGYLDASCTQRAIGLFDPVATMYVAIAQPRTTSACAYFPTPLEDTAKVFALGAQQPSMSTLYDDASGACAPSTTFQTVYAASEAD